MSALRTLVVSLTLAAVAVPAAPEAAAGQVDPTKQKKASDTLDAPPPAVDLDTIRLGRDTLVAAPGQTYSAGAVHRFFLGDLNRDLWALEFPVPVLDLDSVGGGLVLQQLSGGKQTLGLRFEGADGLIYQFRSIVKTPSRAIPSALGPTGLDEAAEDQMAAQFPLSAMVVAELLQAADVMVAEPRPVIMPDDPRLGEYREAFAGRMGWIEIRPDERESEEGVEYAGFAGSSKITGTEELFEELHEHPESFVDDRKLIRARLIDMLVGDWDRHADQWRWASYPEGPRKRWEPIPRDRDWALVRVDGLLPRLVAVYVPMYVSFEAERPDPFAMHWNSQNVDRTFLTELEREDFIEAAREVREALTDEVLESAVGVLPASYRRAVGGELLNALRVRRDALDDVAREFYELLAEWVDVRGTEAVDSVALVPGGEGSLRVTLTTPRDGDFVRFDRTFHASETRELRIYLHEGDDRVVVHGPLPMTVRLVTGEGDDVVVDLGDGRNLLVYDDQGDNRFDLGPRAFRTGSRYLRQDSAQVPQEYLWAPRDWGSVWVPRPELWFDSDIGLYVGLGLARYGFGFGRYAHRSRFSVSALNGMDADEWILNMELDRALGDRGWRTVGRASGKTEDPVWLFGFGNGVPAPDGRDAFRSIRRTVTIGAALRYKGRTRWEAEVGPELALTGAVEPGGVVFDTADVYGAGAFDRLGLRGSFELDGRDDRDYPRSGRVLRVEGRVVPALLDAEEAYGGIAAELREYLALDVPGEPALHLRLRGERTWGRPPFFALAHVGGSGSLPGFVRRRFLGDGSASATGLFRIRLLQPHVFTDLELGTHAIGAVGRVWSDEHPSRKWHVGRGGGAWLRLPSIERTLSVSLVRGDAGLRAYLDFGFLF